MDAAGWDDRYGKGQVWSSEPNRFFAEAVQSLRLVPGRALDLACGEGRNAVWLAEHGWQVRAVDFSEVGIDRGRAGAVTRGVDVDWCVADLADWDLGSGMYRLVAHVYLHWPAVERVPFFDRCAAAVAPGGVVVVVGHDRDNIEHGHGGPQDPDVLTTPEEMREQFGRAGLEVVRAERVRRTVTLEPGHGGSAPPRPDGHGAGDATDTRTDAVDAIDHVVVARRTV